ncbi:hypothetical protein M5X11_16650 [Paenibacillus alginolyticus]|uniref:hypothetical protein n=1 Tax=Paenibacillus alginolyticus TaxID=59839 RepID=UPI0004208514|nr:hypothetical protein [Paenibacillus alginolyticus]MCY9666546.1 hypothetical protein [Paenibacillus alginolyticus]
MKKTKSALFAIILLAVTFTGCMYNTENSNYIVDNIDNYNFIPKGEGTSFGLVNDDRSRTVEERNFSINSKEQLTVNLLVANGTKITKDFIILPIVDYNKALKNFPIKLTSNQTTVLPINLGKLASGNHDIIFLIIKDPNNIDLSEDYRKSTDLSHVLAIKINVIVDSKDKPKLTTTPFKTNDNNVLDGIFLSKGEELKRWLIEESSSSIVDYTVQVGNTKKEEYTYAIISLMNWKIAPLSNGEKAIFGKVKPNTRNIYTETAKTSNENVNNFTSILIPYPYEKVDRINQMGVEPSIRVAIVNNN